MARKQHKKRSPRGTTKGKRAHESPLSTKKGEIPPGATKKASDHDLRPGERPYRTDDHHAAGTPGGGTEIGGLAGSNYGDGEPEIEELNEAMGSGIYEPEGDEEEAYSGRSGGAVGGTPAEKRASGGRTVGTSRGIKPGGTHRGDSTIGSDPGAPTD